MVFAQSAMRSSFAFLVIGLIVVPSAATEVNEVNLDVTYRLSYPGSGVYISNDDIAWRVSTPKYAKISAQFTALDVESCGSCSCDSVSIYDGPDENSPLLGKFCKNNFDFAAQYFSSGNVIYVHFVSDPTDNFAGFVLNFEEHIEPETTTVTTRATLPPVDDLYEVGLDVTYQLAYPGSGSYTSNENIAWRVSASNNAKISAHFTALDVEGCGSCSCDSVSIYDGPDANSPLLGKFCKSNFESTARYFSSGNVLYVHFVSDASDNYAGFILNFEENIETTTSLTRSTPQPAFHYLISESGSLSHPAELGSFYLPNEHLVWQISLPNGGTYKLKFTVIDIPSCGGSSCLCDSITVYDGPSLGSPAFGKYCNANQRSEEFVTTGDSFVVQFLSDGLIQGFGFTIAYERIIPETTTAPTTTTSFPTTTEPAPIRFDIESESGEIRHPSDGESAYYLANQRIHWHVSTPRSGQYVLKFILIDIPGCEECTCDHVALYDGASTAYPLLGKFCNRVQPDPAGLSSTHNEFLVEFKSDGFFEGFGFRLTYELKAEESTTANPTTRPFTTTPQPEIFLIEEDYGEIKHPSGNEIYYSANQNIAWLIKSKSQRSLIVQFIWLDIPSCGGLSCACDSVSIYDGSDIESPLIGRFCTLNEPTAMGIPSRGDSVYVHFKSDGFLNGMGFKMSFYVEPDTTPVTSTTSTAATTKVDTATVTSERTTPSSQEVIWPRDQDLLGLWPLDSNYGLSDASRKTSSCSSCDGVLSTQNTGPFGQSSSSYTTNGKGGSIMEVMGARPTSESSLTITLFLRAPIGNVGGLLSFTDIHGEPSLQLALITQQNRPLLEIRGPNRNVTGLLGIYDVLQPNEWSFVAIVFENSEWAPCMLSIHGRHGTIYKPIHKESLCDFLTTSNNFKLGYSYPDEPTSSLSPIVSVSCLTLYSSVLAPSELRQVQEACRAIQRSPPCGAPKLPIPATPLTTTNEPIYGQFPWIASIRLQSDPDVVICSASIIDRFFLLTAASCVKSAAKQTHQKHNYNYLIRVGDYDAVTVEPYERWHEVRNIWIHPYYNDTFGDIAIIELKTAIDFKNTYVNDLCLPEFKEVFADGRSDDGAIYFLGWGKNGRISFTDHTSPRYVSGLVLPEDKCQQAWSAEYNPHLSVCYESLTTKRVPCDRDEGGALMVPDVDSTGAKLLKTVAIYGKRSDDCSGQQPALFTQIAPYVQWMTQTIACKLPGASYPTSCPVNNS